MGVGITKSDAVFTSGRGIAASAAQLLEQRQENSTEVFDYQV